MRALWSTATALCAIAISLTTAAVAAQAPALDDTLARFDAYLSGYEPKLSEIIADELMIQEMSLPFSRTLLPRAADSVSRSRVRRRIQSETAFVSLPGNAAWLGIRHVKSVNNQPVDGSSASLATSLQAPSDDAARALLRSSAQFNLGLPRTTNLPNLPLEFLHQRNRRRLIYRLDGTERIRGADTTRVVFIERITPTVIADPDGVDMPSTVRAWIDRTGRLLRAEVTTFRSLNARDAVNTLRVEFTEHAALGLLVPREMRETFPVDPPRVGTGVAHYSNFRRFQTSARIVPQ